MRKWKSRFNATTLSASWRWLAMWILSRTSPSNSRSRVGAGACAANGLALELDPQLVEVFEVGDRQRRHPRAPVVAEDDETFGFEDPQRLADRDEAGAAPLGDCLREQLRVVRVLAADDAAAEVLYDVMDGAVPVTAACGGDGVYLRLRGPNHGWYIIQL